MLKNMNICSSRQTLSWRFSVLIYVVASMRLEHNFRRKYTNIMVVGEDFLILDVSSSFIRVSSRRRCKIH